MAAQYSNRHFFRKTPNIYLAQYFAAKGVQLTLDLTELKENDAEALQTALNALEDSTSVLVRGFVVLAILATPDLVTPSRCFY